MHHAILPQGDCRFSFNSLKSFSIHWVGAPKLSVRDCPFSLNPLKSLSIKLQLSAAIGCKCVSRMPFCFCSTTTSVSPLEAASAITEADEECGNAGKTHDNGRLEDPWQGFRQNRVSIRHLS